MKTATLKFHICICIFTTLSQQQRTNSYPSKFRPLKDELTDPSSYHLIRANTVCYCCSLAFTLGDDIQLSTVELFNY